MANEEPWHLDKRVPVALIFAIFAQTAGAIWWAANINSRVENNTALIDRVERQQDNMRTLAQTQAVQLGRIEEQLAALRGDIGRLVVVLERNQR